MCGIAGSFLHKQAAFDECRLVASLCAMQSSRGPDGEGFWNDPAHRLSLGHRRLAIIDTGASGRQPMTDASNRYVITFNGEIYNYQSLRRELLQLGMHFKTLSDTEVILAVYAKWGPSGFSRLRGMFAFAIWDAEEEQLCIARDPFGIKPLYIAEQTNGLCFASSARALAHTPIVDSRREPAAVAGYYLWGNVPEPFTWWSGIKMFPPGHHQMFRAGRALTAPERFFKGRSFANVGQPSLPRDSLRSALEETVEAHLVADVPVGLFLSAGIDSSAIAAAAARLGRKPVGLTLSFESYTDPAIDEVALATNFARSLGLPHNVFYLQEADIDDALDAFLTVMDQPTIDGFNAYLVSQMAAKAGLKVALCGVGADELFGGYPSFKQIPPLLAWSKRMPARTMAKVLEPFAPMAKILGVSPKMFAVPGHSESVTSAYLLRRSLYLEKELDALHDTLWLETGRERLQTLQSLSASIEDHRPASAHAQISALESTWYLRNQLLRDWDWAGMAHGIEIRTPFVDIALITQLDPFIGSNHPPSKRDLADAALLPSDIANRTKTGFTTPLSEKRRGGIKHWADRVFQTFQNSDAAFS